MEVTFKPAESSDCETLFPLMREFYAHEQLVFDEQLTGQALRQLLAEPLFGRVWLIFCGAELAGYAVLTLGYSLEFRGRDAFVDELYVREEFRGRGIGTRTLQFLAAACRSLGVQALHLEVARENTKAQDVYRRFGFQDHDRYLLTKWLS